MNKINIDFLGYTKNIYLNYPNVCPHCGRVMSPKLVSVSNSDQKFTPKHSSFSLTFKCSYTDCQKYFAVEYIATSESQARKVDYSYRPPVNVNFPAKIMSLSNMFASIYFQSAIAESEHFRFNCRGRVSESY